MHRARRAGRRRGAGSPSASTPAAARWSSDGREAADLGPRAVLAVEPPAPLVVDVLGRVGQQRQPAEGPDQVQLVVDRPAGQRRGERVERAAAVAPGVDGPPADRLDELEDLVAGLVAHDVAEQPAEQADVVAERGVLAVVRHGVPRPRRPLSVAHSLALARSHRSGRTAATLRQPLRTCSGSDVMVPRVRVLMLAWEFPPRSVGGIAAHVDGLCQALARGRQRGRRCSRLSHPGAPADSTDGGVRVLRARTDLPWLPDDDLVARVASANHHLVQLVDPSRRRLGTRRRARPRLAGRLGRRHAARRCTARAARRHVPRHRARPSRRAGTAR